MLEVHVRKLHPKNMMSPAPHAQKTYWSAWILWMPRASLKLPMPPAKYRCLGPVAPCYPSVAASASAKLLLRSLEPPAVKPRKSQSEQWCKHELSQSPLFPKYEGLPKWFCFDQINLSNQYHFGGLLLVQGWPKVWRPLVIATLASTPHGRFIMLCQVNQEKKILPVMTSDVKLHSVGTLSIAKRPSHLCLIPWSCRCRATAPATAGEATNL